MKQVWATDYNIQASGNANNAIDFNTIHLAIVGPGGTGKPAVLRVTEALINIFAGPESVQQLALSNAAARLLGGDTIHALCKLPFGNDGLQSKKGRLTKQKLLMHRNGLRQLPHSLMRFP